MSNYKTKPLLKSESDIVRIAKDLYAISGRFRDSEIISNGQNLGPQSGVVYVSSEEELLQAESSSTPIVIIQDDLNLSSDLTITKELRILNGAVVNCNGHSLTIEGPFYASLVQCFIPNSPATPGIGFKAGSTFYILPEWFGAKGDGITDDTNAIQACLNASVTFPENPLPINLTPLKTYIISAITLPLLCNIGSESDTIAAPKLKCNLLGATMVTLPTSSLLKSYINIHGIYLDGDSIASNLININKNQYVEIRDCYLANAVSAGIDHYLGGRYNKIYDNIFFNNGVNINFANSSFDVRVERNQFLSGMLSANKNMIQILTTPSGTPGGIDIIGNQFQGGLSGSLGFSYPVSAHVQIDVTWGAWSTTATLVDNNFASYATSGLVNVTKGGRVIIEDNWFSTGTSNPSGIANNLLVFGSREGIIENNFFARTTCSGAAVYLTPDSYGCKIGPQVWDNYPAGGPFGSYIVDSGTLNRAVEIVRKGTTAARPSGLSATLHLGLMYLDTTLDVDGMPIYWNGSKWIKSDGSDA